MTDCAGCDILHFDPTIAATGSDEFSIWRNIKRPNLSVRLVTAHLLSRFYVPNLNEPLLTNRGAGDDSATGWRNGAVADTALRFEFGQLFPGGKVPNSDCMVGVACAYRKLHPAKFAGITRHVHREF